MPMNLKAAQNEVQMLENIAHETGVAVRSLPFDDLRILRDHPTDRAVPLLYFYGSVAIEKQRAVQAVQTYGEASR